MECFYNLGTLVSKLQSEASENNVEAELLTLLAFFDEKDISE